MTKLPDVEALDAFRHRTAKAMHPDDAEETITTQLADQLKGLAGRITPGEWEMHRGFSDWGMPRTNSITTAGGDPYEPETVVAEVQSLTPYCAGASRSARKRAVEQDANAEFIALVRNNLPEIIAALEEGERMREALSKNARTANARLVSDIECMSTIIQASFEAIRDTARAALGDAA